MKTILNRISVLFFLLIFLSVSLAPKVSANALPYSWSGGGGNELLAGEGCPIEVRGEKLSFVLDSRKSGYTLQADAAAVYHLANPLTEPCTFAAVFPIIPASELDIGDSEVLWKGEPVPFRRAWQWEHSMPEPLAALGQKKLILLDFSLALGPGEEGELVVRFRTQGAMERDTIFHYLTTETRYTFLYFLSPAQYWGDFEHLEIDLRLSGTAPILQESSLDFRNVGWRRYAYRCDGLPNKELSFTAVHYFWVPIVRLVLLIGLLIGVIVFLRKWRRKE